MKLDIPSLNNLTHLFSKLPGIGKKSAQRLAFHIIEQDELTAKKLAQAIVDVKDKIRKCEKCYNLSEKSLCPICESVQRDQSLICVVETPRDLIAIENTNEFKGMYHVLHGAISPIDGIGPEDIYIKELVSRLNDSVIREVIIATNSTIEGEATALYLKKLLSGFGLKITRIAHGVPVGGDFEYIDEVTLAKSLLFRREIE